MLRLKLLGGVSLESDIGVLRGPATQRHRLALLALLAASYPRSLSRDKLTAWLWPERDNDHARNLLNQAVHALRRTIGEDAIVSVGDEVHFDCGRLHCDVIAFENALSAGDYARAVRLYNGELLDGFFLSGAAEFERWVEGERQRFRRAYSRALETLADSAYAAGDVHGAVEWWRRRAAEEPADGRVTRCLMQALARAGDRAGALRQARIHAALLEKEFGAQPDEQVAVLAAQLRTQARLEGGGPNANASSYGVPQRTTLRAAPHSDRASIRLVGRRAALAQLQASWVMATEHRSLLVLISGEAGIGKTRLAEEFLDRVVAGTAAAARTRCYAAEGRLAYAPVADWLRSAAVRPGVAALNLAEIAEIARLLPELRTEYPQLGDPQPVTEPWQRQRLFTALATAVRGFGDARILFIDDVQWCDSDTLHWLHFLLRFDAAWGLLVIATARSEEVLSDHPCMDLLRDLRRSDQLREIAIGPLTADETAELATEVAGRALDTAETAELYRISEGSPLFVVECVRAGVVERNRELTRRDTSLRGPSPAAAEQPLPDRVRAILQSRLAQLSPAAHKLAGVAATLGRNFSFELLARASTAEAEQLAENMDELCRRGIIRDDGVGGYDFSHDKLREVAYHEIGPGRTQLLHRRAGEALEEVYASDLDPVSGQLAAHYDRAGLPASAIPFYQRAGDVATRIYAHEDAIAYYSRARALLEAIPAGQERDRRELMLLLALGVPVQASRGWAAPELGPIVQRASELSERAGEKDELLMALCSLASYELVRGERLEFALKTAEQAFALTRATIHEAALTPANYLVAATLCQLGRFREAHEYVQAGIAAYRPQFHEWYHQLWAADYRVFCICFNAHVLWHLGFADRATSMCGKAIVLADELEHPFSRAAALAYSVMLQQFARERDAVEAGAGEVVAFCDEHGFPYYRAWGMILHGWALAMRGDTEGLPRIRNGLELMRATGASLRRGYYVGLLAESCGRSGGENEAITLIEECLEIADRTGEHWKDAELHRLKGELLLADARNARKAERCFRQALSVARTQEARMLELRSAVSLGRLLRDTSRGLEGRRILEPIRNSFEEGADAADLKEATALLAQLE